MEKIYNKLVRDNIPEIIKNNGENPIVEVLNEKDYECELIKKLFEECTEVEGAKTKVERIEELADVLEIIISIAKLDGALLENVIEAANEKRSKRGGFEKRLFLKTVIKGEKTNE